MEGVWLVPLIKFYMKDLFGMFVELSYLLSSTNQYFFTFLHHGTQFYDIYITSYDRKKYIDDYGSVVFPKQNIRKIYNAKYQNTYSNRYYILKNEYIKYTRIHWTYLGRK